MSIFDRDATSVKCDPIDAPATEEAIRNAMNRALDHFAGMEPIESDPSEWPSWVDDFTWELGPEPTEDPDPVDVAWWAAESAAIDHLELGLIPFDLAEQIARTSLVGHDAA